MIVVINPRTGEPDTVATGSIDLPSNVATPSSVPIPRTPSALCASVITDDCGSPRQLDLLNVRNDRVGVHSSPRAPRAASASAHTITPVLAREQDMGTLRTGSLEEGGEGVKTGFRHPFDGW